MGRANWVKAARLNKQWTAEKLGHKKKKTKKNPKLQSTHKYLFNLKSYFSLDCGSQLWDLLPVNIWILETHWNECSDQWILSLNIQIFIQT